MGTLSETERERSKVVGIVTAKIDALIQSEPAPTPFKRLSISDLLSRAAPEWLVHDVMKDVSVGALFGRSTLGKSFVAMDLACTVARQAPGMRWFGHDVDQSGGVVYVHAEGRPDDRVRAYLAHNALEPEDLQKLQFIEQAPNLTSVESIDALLRELEDMSAEVGPLRLIILDTYSQCVAGQDQNASQTASMAVQQAIRVATSIGAVVLLVAHPGWGQSERIGNSYQLHAGLDFEVRVDCEATEPKAEDIRTLHLIKNRDAPVHCVGAFTMRSVEVRTDGRGRAVRSLVVEAMDELPEAKPKGRARSANDQRLVDAVRACATDSPATAFKELKACGIDPTGHLVAPERAVRDMFLSLATGKQEAKRQAWGRAKKDLIASREVAGGVAGGVEYLWLPVAAQA